MNKYTKIGIDNELSITIAASIVDKVIKRSEYLAYSRQIDKWLKQYSVDMQIGMMETQILWDYIPYNGNVEYNINEPQMLSARSYASGTTEKILQSSEGCRINRLMHNEEVDEPIPAVTDTLAASSLKPKHRTLHNVSVRSITTPLPGEETSNRISLSKQKFMHLRQGKSKAVPVALSVEDTMQLDEDAQLLKQK